MDYHGLSSYFQVDLNNDGVIDYQEFITLVKGKHLGLGSKRRKAFRQLLKETVEFLVPYKYTYQVSMSSAFTAVKCVDI